MKDGGQGDFAGRVWRNQQRLSSELKPRFDYLVCGAGTSGCVVAARLAADPKTQVLLLEAGGSDETELISDPNRWPMTLGTELDWGFVAEPNPKLNGRAIPYSMGKVLGGGSSVNVSTWSRGHQADWDFYAFESGDPAWGYEAVLDLYRRRIEAWTGTPDPEYRGTGGMVHVQPAGSPHPFSYSLLEGAESVGLPRFPNPNGRMMESAEGCAFVDETVRHGKRQSIFRSYLYPVMAQPNLTVLTGALAARILFYGHRAGGLEFHYQGKTQRVLANREIILSLGAIHTPKKTTAAVAAGAPNFYAYARRGPEITRENAARFNPPVDSWSLVVGMRPMSRGAIHLTGPHPADPVKIDPGYLGDSQDLKDLVTGLNMAREIGNSAALRPFTRREVAPGSLSTAELERFFRDGLGTFWHQSGTAKMGRDAMSVVDGQLRVHGVEGLRVADASILPRVTTGNTMAPCVVIGEQAVAFLQQKAGANRTSVERSDRRSSPVRA